MLEIVRDGARHMLAAALQAEVAAYIEQFADQVDENGRRLVVRNGYYTPRDVLTAARAVTVKAPRVNDTASTRTPKSGSDFRPRSCRQPGCASPRR
ncbi:transposase [Rhodococcus wratislaviensis IFP 2016]|nr:transposase [Rhodococcus wratislaviensis IFP 2016]